MRWTALLLLAAPVAAAAQDVTVRARGVGPGAALIDSVLAGPHRVRTGTGPVVLPRDSTVTTSLVIIGQPAYVASTVRGDVIVIGGDLYLRPGVDISGRAIAIGGTVAETTLGRVGGSVQSLRDETFVVEAGSAGGPVVLSGRDLRQDRTDSLGIVRLAGIRGIRVPSYDRVNGLSVPVGVRLVPGDGNVVLEPTLTYRSRLGVVDPALAYRHGPEEGNRLEARVARDTRTNDAWITSEIINSLKTFAFGTDTRNYFRSDIAEAFVYRPRESGTSRLEPFVGARYERVFPITSVGNVYSILFRGDSDKVRRPNPEVERGHVGSALVGVDYRSMPEDAPIRTGLRAGIEQSLVTPAGTSNFTQLTLDGIYQFPTFATHRLHLRAHAVGTLGDATPMSRYAYLGGSRTLGLSELLEFGGDQLVFVDSRYLIPIEQVQLPVVGPPTLSFIHRIGGAGIGSLGSLEQEVGAALALGPIDVEVMIGASGQNKTRFGIGISLPTF
jgi:hypothetical protein